jgi:predicted transglutaminase-like cysteine proteinase
MAEIAGKGSSEQYVRHVVQDVLNANRPVHWRHDDDGDYWRTMQQTVANDYKGDCEDISIYWYILLRRTGAISDSSLSLRIVHLPGYPEKELHTVCVIRTDGATLVIDNGILCNDGPRFGEIILECDLFSIFS